MAALFFDVDDTLYDQLHPFQQAYNDHFTYHELDIEKLFMYSRMFSDQVFSLSESGAMSSDDMKIYRIQKALQAFGKEISSSQALDFQASYERYQQKIELSKQMTAVLDLCWDRRHELGVITNGPLKHQQAKIKQLRLSRWIAEKNIWISAAVKAAKPERKIFDLAKRNVSQTTHDYYYIGDHFTNDVVGASQAGWQAIWLNKRHHTAENKMESKGGFFQINSEAELYQLLKDMLPVR